MNKLKFEDVNILCVLDIVFLGKNLIIIISMGNILEDYI